MQRTYPDRSRSPRNRGNDGYYARDDYRQRPFDPYDTRGPSRGTRSRSPAGIDRYQPTRDQERQSSRIGPPRPQSRDGPPRNDRNDGRGRRMHHGNNAMTIDRYVPGQDNVVAREREAPLFNPIPKPEQLPYLVQYLEFRDWWTKEQEINEERERRSSGRRNTLHGDKDSREAKETQREKLQDAYDEYKESFIGKSTKAFVRQRKGEEWFKERYNLDVRVPFRQRLAGYRLDNYERWSNDLTSGVFDDFNLEGIYKGDSNGAGGVLEKEEGEAMGAAEVQAVSDLVPAKGADLLDEAAKQPALLIKTMAAHVQRNKIEDFCKEHLGEGPGGYRWLSLGEPNVTKKFTRLGWVLLRPKEGGDAVTNGHARGDGRDDEDGEGKGEDEAMDDAERKQEETPKSYVEQAHAQVDNKVIEDEEKGNFTCHFGVHDSQASPRKKALWDLMSFPDRIERDLEWATRLTLKLEQELGSEADGVSMIDDLVERLRGEGRLQPVTSQSVSGKAKKQPAILGEEIESGEEEDEEEEEMMDEEEVDDEELLAKKKRLDLLVEYLRRVYNFCFFCVMEADSVIDLERKCAGGHLRRPRASLTTLAKKCARATVDREPFPLRKGKAQDDEEVDGAEATDRNPSFDRKNNTHLQLQKAFSWITRYEDMLRQVVEPEKVDLKKLGARPMEEALDEDLKAFRLAEAEGERFRCKITEDCKKMFKTEHFWRKHVDKRHTEWLEGVKKELTEIEAFALDPNHIQTYNVGANGMARNNMMQGFPRNAGMNGFPSSFGNASFGPPMGLPPMQMQASFGQMMGNMAMGGIGPARRGGRQNTRAAGPYDRQPADARAMRWRGSGGSDMAPPRSARPQVFPDAVAGGGSKEAVEGRTMRSYQDMDAVPGASKPDMDY